jgi:very-short-patch-repair endonuclease
MGEKNTNPAWELPQHIIDALNEGRYAPGWGPWYCTRILPVVMPRRRKELLAGGVTRRTLERDYVTLTRGIVVPAAEIPDSGEDRGVYGACGVLRARAFHILYPDRIVAGWQAAALHGLPYWADAAPVLMLSHTAAPSGTHRTAGAAEHPYRVVVRRPPKGFDSDRDTVTPDPVCPEMRVVTVPVALAQCIRSVLSGHHTWPVPDVPGLTDREVRAVQLIDAFVQCTRVTAEELADAAKGLVSRRQVRKLTGLACQGAESPRETLLRLYVWALLPAGYRWRTQVAVRYLDLRSDGSERIRTTYLDLGCTELKVGLYYDGGHHTAAGQTDRDFAQLQDLRDEQWTVVRIDKDLMKNVRKMLTQVGTVIGTAVQTRDRDAGDAGDDTD